MGALLKNRCNKSAFPIKWKFTLGEGSINARAGAMLTEVSFRNLAEMPSGPEAL